MKRPALGLLLLGLGCSTGPYSLDAQLGRRLGNIRKHLEPASVYRTATTRVSNIVDTTGNMVQVSSRLNRMGTAATGAVVGEWTRTERLPDSITSFVATGVDRFDRTVRKFGNPPPAWVDHLSPTRILGRLGSAIHNLGTILGLDRRPLPMPSDPERQTDPEQAPGPTPNLWDRILYRLRLTP